MPYTDSIEILGFDIEFNAMGRLYVTIDEVLIDNPEYRVALKVLNGLEKFLIYDELFEDRMMRDNFITGMQYEPEELRNSLYEVEKSLDNVSNKYNIEIPAEWCAKVQSLIMLADSYVDMKKARDEMRAKKEARKREKTKAQQ